MNPPHSPDQSSDELFNVIYDVSFLVGDTRKDAEAWRNKVLSLIRSDREKAQLEARIDEVEKALVAGSIRTVPTKKGNNVEWWPNGLNKTLNERLTQLRKGLK